MQYRYSGKNCGHVVRYDGNNEEFMTRGQKTWKPVGYWEEQRGIEFNKADEMTKEEALQYALELGIDGEEFLRNGKGTN